ncbi:MAG: hypothetical protein ABI237_15310 [Ginsengibacter sp.]
MKAVINAEVYSVADGLGDGSGYPFFRIGGCAKKIAADSSIYG